MYEGLADSLHVDATWYQREKVNGGTFATLQELVTELQLDFLIVGSFGRKARCGRAAAPPSAWDG